MAALSWFEDHGCGVWHTSVSPFTSVNEDNHTSSKVDRLRGTLSIPKAREHLGIHCLCAQSHDFSKAYFQILGSPSVYYVCSYIKSVLFHS